MRSGNKSRRKCPAFKILARFIHFILAEALACFRDFMKTDGETDMDFDPNRLARFAPAWAEEDAFTEHVSDQQQ